MAVLVGRRTGEGFGKTAKSEVLIKVECSGEPQRHMWRRERRDRFLARARSSAGVDRRAKGGIKKERVKHVKGLGQIRLVVVLRERTGSDFSGVGRVCLPIGPSPQRLSSALSPPCAPLRSLFLRHQVTGEGQAQRFAGGGVRPCVRGSCTLRAERNAVARLPADRAAALRCTAQNERQA